jgi:hypothetical protein
MDPFDYTCPFCRRDTTIVEERYSGNQHFLRIENAEGPHYLFSSFCVCPNPKCKKFSLTAVLVKGRNGPQGFVREGLVDQWNLRPGSTAKLFSDCVPTQLRIDYAEACDTLRRSPKASAALSRRVLQGMIRDFHEIENGTLAAEIDALKGVIDDALWEAIDAVRKVGNIGARMDTDVNLILDVEPGEPEQLVGLVELLFKEWYVARDERGKSLAKLKAIADAKVAERLAARATATTTS